MSTSLTLHLFKTDCRRNLAWLIVYFALSLVQAFLGINQSTAMAPQLATNLTCFGQLVFAAVLIVTTMHGDAVVNDSAGWRTRPVTRRELLGAKFIYIGGLIQGGFLLSCIPGWFAAGFSPSQFFSAMVQWTILSSVSVWSVAAAAAWSSDFKTLATRAGVMVCAVVGFLMLIRFIDLPLQPRSFSPALGTTILCLNMSVIAAGAILSWMWAVLRARIPLAMYVYAGGLLLALLLTVTWPFELFAHRHAELTGTRIEVIEDLSITNELGADEQFLWSHFRADRLPTNTMLVPTLLRAHFKRPDAKRTVSAVHSQVHHNHVGASLLFHGPTSGEVARRLRQFYPRDTLWFGRMISYNHSRLPVENVGKNEIGRGTRGRFYGSVEASGIELRPFVDLPLVSGESRSKEGVSVQVLDLRHTESGREVRIRERVPRLWWSDRPEWTGARFNDAFCLYVVYDPVTGEAWPYANQGSRRSVSAPWYNTRQTTIKIEITRSSLLDRLAGRPTDDTGELRLHVYMPRELGRISKQFELNDYAWAVERGIQRDRPYAAANISDITGLSWPGMSDPAAARQYLDDLINRLPERIHGETRNTAREKLMAIGAEGLPLLLERVPFRYGLRYGLTDSVIERLATREHLTDMLAALERSPDFARLFTRKRWEDAAVEVILRKLPERRIPLTTGPLAIAARTARPEHYSDLQWHAVHHDGESIHVLPQLEKLPGFPMEKTVRARWRRNLVVNRNDNGIRAYAARLGEPGALAAFVVDMEEKRLSSSREKQLIAVVRQAVEFTGNDAELKAWLSENLGRLRFDPVLKRYRL